MAWADETSAVCPEQDDFAEVLMIWLTTREF
jgi:hypothetical protein